LSLDIKTTFHENLPTDSNVMEGQDARAEGLIGFVFSYKVRNVGRKLNMHKIFAYPEV
jgi:hypothetical protein